MIVATTTAWIVVLMAPQTAPDPSAWTWTLYADTRPVVLSNEIVDTPQLRSTLECDPGTGVARLTLYGPGPTAGMARVIAGEASAIAETQAGHAGSMKLALRIDHPAFAAFAMQGRLGVTVGEQARSIVVPREHLAKLRRFAELCIG